MEYELKRSARKTVSLEIRPDGSLLVRAPLLMSQASIRRFVEAHRDWVEKRMRRREALPDVPPMTEEALAALKKRARPAILERVAYYAPLVGVRYGSVSIRSQHSRWGSCSSKGNLNFNCLLLLAPPEVLDYVVVHELCHRIELNHSARFWAEVARVLPDWKARRDKIRAWEKIHPL
jgi:predicted metal-dependent hydrolase